MDYYTQQAKNGRKGGKMTLKLHGVSHFSKAGKKAARKRSKKK